ncbi:MAG: ribosome maturation factor RimM [Alphaproteobacteria bacterium]
MARAGNDTLVVLGVVTGAIGVRGELKIKHFTETPFGLNAYGPLVTAKGDRFKVKGVRPVKTGAGLKLEGVNDRNAAEALKGTELCVPRAAMGDADEDDAFFYVDLIGLRAEDEDGDIIGSVIAVQNFGAGDLLDIRLEETGKTELVAFTEAAVPVVDIKGGRVVVRLETQELETQEGEGEPE